MHSSAAANLFAKSSVTVKRALAKKNNKQTRFINNNVEIYGFRFAYEYAKRYTVKKQKELNEVELGKAFWKCVRGRHRGCYFEEGREYDLSIPYFCGQEPKCR